MKLFRPACSVLFVLVLPLLITACDKTPEVASPSTSSTPAPTPASSLPVAKMAVQARAMLSEEKEDIAYMDKHTKPGMPYRLNLGHPAQYRHVLHALQRSGVTAETAPQLYRSLAAGHAKNQGNDSTPVLAVQADGGPEPLNYISSFDLQAAPGTFQATGLSSVNGGTEATTVVMDLYSIENNRIYAANTQSTSQYAQGEFFQVPVSGSVPAGLNDPTTKAQGIFTYVPVGGDINNPIVVRYATEDTVNPSDGCMEAPNYCVRVGSGAHPDYCRIPVEYQTTCTNKVTNTTPINVCYTRGSQQECDYYNQTPNHPTNFLFPLQGNVDFGREIYSPPQGMVTITLESQSKGGGCYLVFKELAPLDPTSWSVNGSGKTTLNWNFTAASFPDPNSCLEYYGGTNTYMHVQVDNLLLQGGSEPPALGSFKFTSNRSQIGQPGIYIVPSIEIQQGCFAAGTQIMMADGSLKPVENFIADHNEQVKTGSDEERIVLATTSGIEPEPMVRLKTDKGHDLLLTRTHPVVSIDGVIMAMDLKAGDSVKTQEGTAKLTSVAREDYTGKVYNLRLAASEQMSDVEAGKTTVYANGILTGDAAMQRYHEKLEVEKLKTDSEHVLKRLAPEWHEDYLLHMKRSK